MRPAILNPLFQPLANLHGLGRRFAPLLVSLAGSRVIDLLMKLLPKKIIERHIIPNLSEIKDHLLGQYVIVRGKIVSHLPPEHRFGKNRPYKIFLGDGGTTITLTFFIQQGGWLKKQYPEGADMVISGVLNRFQNEWQITHPDMAMPASQLHYIPLNESIYPKGQSLPQKVIQKSIKESLQLIPSLPEWLSPDIISQWQLPTWQDALQKIHNPKHPDDLLPQSPQKLRLAMDEILAWQLVMKKTLHEQKPMAEKRQWLLPTAKLFPSIEFPFSLTAGQTSAINDIENDLASLKQMTRLLMGDVGSGKTIIALYAMLRTVEKNFLENAPTIQAALLAPTEILAEQHFQNFQKWLSPYGITPLLLTGRMGKKQKEEKRHLIQQGACHIVIGTHAIIQETILFYNLRLLVIDEQQRFGVMQRLSLYQKSFSGDAAAPPDILLMTATPIPRTLSLLHFGDLDLSLLKEKPPGRQVVETAMVNEDRLAEVIARLKKNIANGASVFWVCPLIEDSDFLNLPSAEARYELAKKYFDHHEIALIHGQMKSVDKQNIIDDFKHGKVKLLIATTVIESGIDIPNATIMVIDHAEHFGLTQLHQLRGRIGRDQIFANQHDNKAYCLLIYHAPLQDVARQRLHAIKQYNDGFYLAEKDLEWRGGGERYGLRQSGFDDFMFFDIFFHNQLLKTASQYADDIIENQLQDEEKIKILLALYEKDKAVDLVKAG
ncbi:MAG: ATP-dependent DNA helicase RecG [Alphaproteobacteria bacterium]